MIHGRVEIILAGTLDYFVTYLTEKRRGHRNPLPLHPLTRVYRTTQNRLLPCLNTSPAP